MSWIHMYVCYLGTEMFSYVMSLHVIEFGLIKICGKVSVERIASAFLDSKTEHPLQTYTC